MRAIGIMFLAAILCGSGCRKSLVNYEVGDVERQLRSHVALDQIELSKTGLGRFTGTAQIDGERYEVQAQINHGDRSLTYAFESETGKPNISGGFSDWNLRRPWDLPNVVKLLAIVLVAVCVAPYLEKRFGRPAVIRWGIVLLIGLAVIAIGLLILNPQ
jgi:hypothetical protein